MLESKESAIKLFGTKIPFPIDFEVAEEEEDEEKSNAEMENTLTKESEKDKTLKKPTKILPCPRCKSMETKFCYYNNYNVNQPRHFCKACQRYWTNGGTMRSVPVGAGRRKNKNNSSSSSRYHHHVTISETNGPFLSFRLGDDQKNYHISTDESRTSRYNKMNGLDCSPGASWPYKWNPGFYPVHPYWNISMLSSLPSSGPKSPVTTPDKHSRDEYETVKRKVHRNGSVLVPKTLRIDDPSEAAKSSIWTTLGIKNEVMFKGFDPKKEIKINKEETEASLVLCANPAALSRSVNFHERM